MSRNKIEYIKALAKVLEARDDFKSLDYRRDSEGNEYMILSSIAGDAFMFDITGFKETQIYHDLALVECGIKPRSFIEDTKRRLEIGRLSI